MIYYDDSFWYFVGEGIGGECWLIYKRKKIPGVRFVDGHGGRVFRAKQTYGQYEDIEEADKALAVYAASKRLRQL